MGSDAAEFTPIPSPTLPLKGREKSSDVLKLAFMTLQLLWRPITAHLMRQAEHFIYFACILFLKSLMQLV